MMTQFAARSAILFALAPASVGCGALLGVDFDRVAVGEADDASGGGDSGASSDGGPGADGWSPCCTADGSSSSGDGSSSSGDGGSSRGPRVVLFGGWDLQTIFGDTWEWDGAAWSKRTDLAK